MADESMRQRSLLSCSAGKDPPLFNRWSNVHYASIADHMQC